MPHQGRSMKPASWKRCDIAPLIRRLIVMPLVGLRPPADSKIATNLKRAMIRVLFLVRGSDKED